MTLLNLQSRRGFLDATKAVPVLYQLSFSSHPADDPLFLTSFNDASQVASRASVPYNNIAQAYISAAALLRDPENQTSYQGRNILCCCRLSLRNGVLTGVLWPLFIAASFIRCAFGRTEANTLLDALGHACEDLQSKMVIALCSDFARRMWCSKPKTRDRLRDYVTDLQGIQRPPSEIQTLWDSDLLPLDFFAVKGLLSAFAGFSKAVSVVFPFTFPADNTSPALQTLLMDGSILDREVMEELRMLRELELTPPYFHSLEQPIKTNSNLSLALSLGLSGALELTDADLASIMTLPAINNGRATSGRILRGCQDTISSHRDKSWSPQTLTKLGAVQNFIYDQVISNQTWKDCSGADLPYLRPMDTLPSVAFTQKLLDQVFPFSPACGVNKQVLDIYILNVFAGSQDRLQNFVIRLMLAICLVHLGDDYSVLAHSYFLSALKEAQANKELASTPEQLFEILSLLVEYLLLLPSASEQGVYAIGADLSPQRPLKTPRMQASLASDDPSLQESPFSRSRTEFPFKQGVFSIATHTTKTTSPSRQVKPGRRGPLSQIAREQARVVKQKGACIRCRELKKKCDDGDPCSECRRVNPKNLRKHSRWDGECRREPLNRKSDTREAAMIKGCLEAASVTVS